MKTTTFLMLLAGLLLSFNAQQAYARSFSMMVPISGMVSVPDADSTEAVTLNGKFHVVVGTSASNPGDLYVHANLADVTGVGSSSGSRFGAMGSTTIVLHNLEDTIVPPSFTFNFNLVKYPPSPCLHDRDLDCHRGKAVTLYPLRITFAVRQTELGFWSTTVSCIASFPPSPCLATDGQ